MFRNVFRSASLPWVASTGGCCNTVVIQPCRCMFIGVPDMFCFMFSMRSLGAICYNLYSLFKEADSETLVPDAAVVGTVSRLAPGLAPGLAPMGLAPARG